MDIDELQKNLRSSLDMGNVVEDAVSDYASAQGARAGVPQEKPTDPSKGTGTGDYTEDVLRRKGLITDDGPIQGVRDQKPAETFDSLSALKGLDVSRDDYYTPLYEGAPEGVYKPQAYASMFREMISAADDPVDMENRLNSAYYLAMLEGIPFEESFNNLDQIARSYYGESLAPKSWYQSVANTWKGATISTQISKLAYQLGQAGGKDEALLARIADLESYMPSADLMKRSLPTEALKAAAQFLPSQIESLTAGIGGGLAGASGAAAAVGVGLAAGLTFTGIGAIAIPTILYAGFRMGSAGGAVQKTHELETGSLYYDLLKSGQEREVDGQMVVERINPEVAWAVAQAYGAVAAATELLPMDHFIASVAGAAGIKEAVKGTGAVAKSAARAGTIQRLFKAFVKAQQTQLGERVADVAGETLQEVVQEAAAITATQYARQITNELDGTRIDPIQRDEVRQRITETLIQSAMGMTTMQILPAGISLFAGGAKTASKAAKAITTIKREESPQGEFKLQEDELKVYRERAMKEPPADMQVKRNTVLEGSEYSLQAMDGTTGKSAGEIRYEFEPGEGDTPGTVQVLGIRGGAEPRVNVELMKSLAFRFAGWDIQFDPKTANQAALKAIMAEQNPRGPEAGVSWYYAEKGAPDKVTAEYMDQRIRDVAPSWTDDERRQSINVLSMWGHRIGATGNEMADAIFAPGVFVPQLVKGTRGRLESGRVIDAEDIAQGVAGATTWRNVGNQVKALVDMAPKANPSTFLHETTHAVVNFMLEVRKGRAQFKDSSRVLSELAAIEAALGIKDGNWDAQFEGWTEEAVQGNRTYWEAFTYAMEDYLAFGKAPKPELESVFAKFARWIMDVYNGLKAARTKMSPELVSYFDNLFSQEGSALNVEQTTDSEADVQPAQDSGEQELELFQGEQKKNKGRRTELAKARAMSEAGEDPDAIRKRTGWRQVRGEWRGDRDRKPVEGLSTEAMDAIEDTGTRPRTVNGAGDKGFAALYQGGLTYKTDEMLEKKPWSRMPGKQILATLRAYGVKPDELEWTGLAEYLDTDEKLTPAQVKEHLDANKLQIDEIEKSWGAFSRKEEANKKETEELTRKLEALLLSATGPDEAKAREADVIRSRISELGFDHSREENTRYRQWVLPGGENYREVLFTLPLAIVKERGTDYVVLNPDGTEQGRYVDREYAERRAGQIAGTVAEEVSEPRSRVGDTYHSPHWNEQNVLAHTRLEDRTDDQDRRVLFIEEIQSDWHQKGREAGYKPEAVQWEKIKIEKSAEGWDATAPDGRTWTVPASYADDADGAAQTAQGYFNHTKEMTEGVPDAPFKKTWHEFVFKRILREAAENFYDAVGWTTGEQQAKRYDLSKQISEILYWHREDVQEGGFVPEPDEIGYSIYDLNGHAVQEQEFIKKASLPDIFGKEVTEKILSKEGTKDANGNYSLSGLDLEVGGEGMEGFYDRMLVDYANKLGKKYGVQVESRRIHLNPMKKLPVYDFLGPQDPSPEFATVHTLQITDGMRDSIMRQGLPLFQGGGNPATLERKDIGIRDVLYQNDPGFPENMKLYDDVLAFHGETDDIKEAGFILPDGRLVDLSGRNEDPDYKLVKGKYRTDGVDYLKGKRMLAHADVRWEDSPRGARGFLVRHGAIRVDAKYGILEMDNDPTPEQARWMARVYDSGQEVAIELHDKDRGADIRNTDPRRALGLVHRFYAGDDLVNAVLWQEAWHGGPHDFDKFSTDYIGSGEGHAAFGWGLYFTGIEGIAKWYAEKETRKRLVDPDSGEESIGGLAVKDWHYNIRRAVYLEERSAAVEGRNPDVVKIIETLEYMKGNEHPEDWPEFERAIEYLKQGTYYLISIMGKRRLYKVDLWKDEEPVLLQWEIEMYEQPLETQAALRKLGIIIPDPDEIRAAYMQAEDLLLDSSWEDQISAPDVETRYNDDDGTWEALVGGELADWAESEEEAAAKGEAEAEKLYNRMRAEAETDARNNLDVNEVIRKAHALLVADGFHKDYDQSWETFWGNWHADIVGDFGTATDEERTEAKRTISMELLSAGIQGVRYSAGTMGGTQPATGGYNYVVFNDSQVTIEKKLLYQGERARQHNALLQGGDEADNGASQLYGMAREMADEGKGWEGFMEVVEGTKGWLPDSPAAPDSTPEEKEAWYKRVWEEAQTDTRRGTELNKWVLGLAGNSHAGLKAFLKGIWDQVLVVEKQEAQPGWTEADAAAFEQERERASSIRSSISESMIAGAINAGTKNAKMASSFLASLMGVIRANPEEYAAIFGEVMGDGKIGKLGSLAVAQKYSDIDSPRMKERMGISERAALATQIRDKKIEKEILSGRVTDDVVKGYIDKLRTEAAKDRKRIEKLSAGIREAEASVDARGREIADARIKMTQNRAEAKRIAKRIKSYMERNAAVPAALETQRQAIEKQREGLGRRLAAANDYMELTERLDAQKARLNRAQLAVDQYVANGKDTPPTVLRAKSEANAEIRALEAKLSVAREYKNSAQLQSYLAKIEAETKIKDRIKQRDAERRAVQKIRAHRAALVKSIMKPAGDGVNVRYAKDIHKIQDSINPENTSPRTQESIDLLRSELASNPALASEIPKKWLLRAIGKNLNEMSLEDIEATERRVRDLRDSGRAEQQRRNRERKEEAEAYRSRIAEILMDLPGYREPTGYEPEQTRGDKIRNKLQEFDYGWMNAQRFAERMDGGTPGQNYELLIKERDRMYREERRNATRRKQAILDRIKELGVNVDEWFNTRVTIVGAGPGRTDKVLRKTDLAALEMAFRNEDSRQAVLFGDFFSARERKEMDEEELLFEGARRFGIIRAAIDANMTPPDMRVIDEAFRPDAAEAGPRLAETVADVENKEMAEVDDYFPINREGVTGTPIDLQVAGDMLDRTSGLRRPPKNGFTKTRIKISPSHQTPVKLDLISTWMESIDRQEHYLANAKYAKRLDAFYLDPFVQEQVRGAFGDAGVDYLKEYITEIKNPGELRNVNRWENSVRYLRGNLGVAYLAFRASSVIKQLVTSPWPALPYAGPRLLTEAFKMMVNPVKYVTDTEELSVVLANRSQDMIFQAIKDNASAHGMEKGMRKVSEIGMKGLEMVDRLCVSVGWRAMYEKAMVEYNGDMVKAIEKADDLTLKTQPSSRGADLAPIYRRAGEGMKLLLQFTQSLNVVYQNLRYDMPNALRNHQWGTAIGTIVGYMIAGVLLNAVTSNPKDDETEEQMAARLLFWSLTQATESFPLIGTEVTRVLKRAVTGENESLLPSTELPGISNILDGMYRLSGDEIDKALLEFATGGGMILGGPVNGVREAYRAASGDIGALAGRKAKAGR